MLVYENEVKGIKLYHFALKGEVKCFQFIDNVFPRYRSYLRI